MEDFSFMTRLWALTDENVIASVFQLNLQIEFSKLLFKRWFLELRETESSFVLIVRRNSAVASGEMKNAEWKMTGRNIQWLESGGPEND